MKGMKIVWDWMTEKFTVTTKNSVVDLSEDELRETYREMKVLENTDFFKDVICQ